VNRKSVGEAELVPNEVDITGKEIRRLEKVLV